MSDHILKTIDQIREEISKAEETLRPKKTLVNQLCELAGIAPMYSGIDTEANGSGRPTIRRNAFYGKPFSTCVREFFEMRQNLPVKEASLEDIFSALKEGGYDLKASGDKEDDQKRGIAIALGKNSQTFHKLPSGDYGLAAWYTNIRERRPRSESGRESSSSSSQQASSSSASSVDDGGEVKTPVSPGV